MNWLANILRRRRKVRFSINSVPLLRELGHSDGALGNAPVSDWDVCQHKHQPATFGVVFLHQNRYISVESFLWWCGRNNINPWGK